MQPIKIPESPILRGEEAISALNEYVKYLEEQKPVELTEKQVNVLIKIGRELISSIKSETSKTSKENIKQEHVGSFKKFYDAMWLWLCE